MLLTQKQGSQSETSMTNAEETEQFPDNPNCEKTHATLRFVHVDLDPDVVTRTLGITPDVTHKRGDSRTGKSGREYLYPRGLWYLTTREWPSRNLEAHVTRLLDRVEPVADLIREFARSHPECRFEIMCYWMSATGQGGPSLSPSTLSRIGTLGATLDFDIYSVI